MENYIVLYRDESCGPLSAPLIFKCQGDNSDHAEEQCTDAYPGCDILWIFKGDSSDEAYADYYGN